MPYASPIRVPDRPTQALAVYCSDGRFVGHTLDFLEHRLGLSLVDAVALPGGPARLLEGDGPGSPLADVVFLVEAHRLTRAVLIQHEDCGHYALQFGVAGPSAASRQRDDLVAAAERLRRGAPTLSQIDLYFLRLDDRDVRFEPVDAAMPAAD